MIRCARLWTGDDQNSPSLLAVDESTGSGPFLQAAELNLLIAALIPAGSMP